MREYTLFETAIGHCGIAWDGETIVGVQLPEARVADTRAKVQDRFDGVLVGDPPPGVQHAIDEMVASLRGEPNDLEGIVLDLETVPPFHRRVYEVVRTIPSGETLSYGEVAMEVGSPGAARAVGRHSVAIRSPSSCRVTGCSRREGRPAASPRMAACRPSCGCSRSKGSDRFPSEVLAPPSPGSSSPSTGSPGSSRSGTW